MFCSTPSLYSGKESVSAAQTRIRVCKTHHRCVCEVVVVWTSGLNDDTRGFSERTEWTRCCVAYILHILWLWFSRRNVFRVRNGECVFIVSSVTSDHSRLLWRRKKASFIWRTLTHTAVHETCYHRQRFTGNAVYHFLSVRVCLGLRFVWSDCRRERDHRRRTPTGAAISRRICLSGPKHALSEDDRFVCWSCSSGAFCRVWGIWKEGSVSLLLSKWAVSDQPRLGHFKTAHSNRERSEKWSVCPSVCVCV